MSREVRRVPATWQHPYEFVARSGIRDGKIRLRPLHGGSFVERAREWDEGAVKWTEGLRQDWGKPGEWTPIGDAGNHGDGTPMTFAEWDGERPVESDYMPDWPDEERTHWQMYETTSEGTPISPVMDSPEALARWLADNGASAFGGDTATYEQWLGMIKRDGWAPSAVIDRGVMQSGVAFVSSRENG